MDFHSLSRKELQTLCKKNKIPANITNVAMADALSALPTVEGLDEFLNPTEAEAGAGTPDTHHRAACRTSTRTKALREEPQSSKVVSSQRPRRGVVAEQENKDANVLPVTPAARRKATTVSTRRTKKEPEMVEDEDEKNGDQGKPTDVPKTPAAVPDSRTRATGRKTEGTSVQRAYNTRRSVRLLEKNLSKMSLVDAEDNGLEKIDDVSEEVSSVSQQIEDSADTEEGASLQTVSNVVSEETDEVSSLEEKTEVECQVHDSGSEVQIVSGEEIDVGAGLEAEPQEEDSHLTADSEPHDSNMKLEGSSETRKDSKEVIECGDVSDVDMNKSLGETVHADNEAGSELLSELEDCCDSSEAENEECLGSKQEVLSVGASEDASMELTEHDVAALTVEVPDDASIEDSGDSSEAENKECLGNKQEALSVEASEDASMEFVEQDLATLITDQDVPGSLPMSPASDSTRLKELLNCNTNQGSNGVGDNQDKNNETEHLNVADGNCIQHFEPMNNVDEKAEDEKDLASPEGVLELGSSNIGEQQEEESEVKSENSLESLAEAEKMDDASDAISAFSPMASEKENANASSEDSTDVIEVCIEPSADRSTNGENFTFQSSLLDDLQEELEAKSEHLKESMVEVGKVLDGASDVTGASSTAIALEKDASSENSVTVEICTESSVDVKNVTLESSLVDVVDVQEAEEQKDNSDKSEAKAQPEESNDHAAAEETALEVLSFDSNTLVEVDVIYAAVVIPKLESYVSEETVTVAPLNELEALSFNSNTPVEVDVISAEVVIPKQESCVSEEAVTVAPINELKASEIPVQSVVAEQSEGKSLCPAQSETKGVADEIQTVPKMTSVEDNMHNANMKENLTTDELQKKSMRELRMMLKKLTLVDGGKSNCKSKTNNAVKEVERKRTALQELPENQLCSE